MNERIKELALKAGFKNYDGPDIWAAEPDHPDDKGRVDIELNKFAQLIIKECTDLCVDITSARNIEEHFGVKL